MSQAQNPALSKSNAALSNIPWEDRPSGSNDVMWRYSQNPVIPRNATPRSNSIFNSAAVPFEDGFAGVFRVDDTRRIMNLHAGHSADGFNWTIDPDPIEWKFDDPELAEMLHRYDPRVVWLEDRYYVTWCNGYHGPTIGIGYTYDFREFTFLENAFLPYNRNGVLFPRKINGKFAMMSRPSDTGHTPFGDIFYSESPDMVHWGKALALGKHQNRGGANSD
jgi:beta-1,4-mannooligosaccharide/beta-1,4-mannosyl-N-acetylglucosamine phosphorylase